MGAKERAGNRWGERGELFRTGADHAALCLDFDGTLAAIVDDPATAVLVDDARRVLDALAGRFALVAVLSGRPVDFLAPQLPGSVTVSGLYGLQLLRDGERRDHPSAGTWREAIEDVVASAAATGPAGMGVESKGLSLTLHYRTCAHIEPQVRDWATDQAVRSGLTLRSARRSIELHPPIEADKGTVLTGLVDGLSPVLYVGDDTGDLPAFDALDRLEAAGAAVLRVAVRGEEAPAELVARADLTLDRPTEVVRFLRSLLA